MVSRGDRGQVFTLEAFVAALVLVLSVVFALQTTGVTPLSASTSSQHVETQQRELLEGTLDSARAAEELRPALLSWDETSDRFHVAGGNGYAMACRGPTAFGALLDRTFYERGTTCNVAVHHVEDGTVRTERMVYTGTPPDTAVSVARTVTLYDDDRLYDAAGDPTNTTLSASTTFYAADEAPNSSVYNVVRLEVTVWQT